MRAFTQLLLLWLAFLSIAYSAAELALGTSTHRRRPLPANNTHSTPYPSLAGLRKRNESHSSGALGSRFHTSDSPLVNEAILNWEKRQLCAPLNYWKRTPETIKESRSEEFFVEWMDQYEAGEYQDECDGKNLTAIQCFASIWWGDFDFGCSVHQIEACSVPSAAVITAWIQRRYPSWSALQVIDTARKVHFISKHFQETIVNLNTDFVSRSS